MTTLGVIESPSPFLLPKGEGWGEGDCFKQMALDEALFVSAQELQSIQPIIRFYQFDGPCATIGFSQRGSVVLQSVDSKGFAWVRRPTGGGVVFHQDDLIYSLIFPTAIHPNFHCAPETYRLIHEMIQSAFKNFGLESDLFSQSEIQKLPDQLVCFKHPVKNDVMMAGEKIAGGAERRSNGFLLHQGSLKLFGIERRNFEARLIHEIEAKLGWSSERLEVSDTEAKLAQELEQSKYKTHGWNWKGKTGFQKDHDKEAQVTVSR